MFATYILIALLPIAYWVVPFLTDSKKLRRFPAPFPAQFSEFWLFCQARLGRRHFAVHELHEKHGKFVRIQPDHVSVADPNAIAIIYGHNSGFLKS
jgi:benzoate 4-monooxygenase